MPIRAQLGMFSLTLNVLWQGLDQKNVRMIMIHMGPDWVIVNSVSGAGGEQEVVVQTSLRIEYPVHEPVANYMADLSP